jgi:hypothetical protein
MVTLFHQPSSPQEAGFSIWQQVVTLSGIRAIVLPGAIRISKGRDSK